MTDAYIFDAVRTPRGEGKPNGALHTVSPLNLVTQLLEAIRDRNHLDTACVEDVILGVVDPIAEQGGNIARTAVLNAGYDEKVPGVQINRFCASGLEAVNMAAAKIMAGQADCVLAGGVESMSRIPMMSSGGAWMVDPQVALKTYFIPQGISADLIATQRGYTRKDVDNYAVTSHHRASHATSQGLFKKSLVPVRDEMGNILLERDEHIRPETNCEILSTLKPSFIEMGEKGGFDTVAIERYPEFSDIQHIHHAGNSSGVVDGASLVLLGSKKAGKRLGLKPRARIRAFASIGSEPCIMLTAPPAVSKKILKKAKMSPTDIDCYEVNEAFAAVVLFYMEEMKISHDKVNVNGGAIAMGHPLGATGAMLVGTLCDELERRNLKTGLVTLCVGAGMGTALIIERV